MLNHLIDPDPETIDERREAEAAEQFEHAAHRFGLAIKRLHPSVRVETEFDGEMRLTIDITAPALEIDEECEEVLATINAWVQERRQQRARKGMVR